MTINMMAPSIYCSMLTYAGEFDLGDRITGRRNTRIVHNLNEIWTRLHRILSGVFYVDVAATPIQTTEVYNEEDYEYAQIFTFDVNMRCEIFQATLTITYDRSVDGKYGERPSDTVICKLDAPGIVPNYPGILHVPAFKEKETNWLLLEHGTDAERTQFLAHWVGRVVARLQHVLTDNRKHMALKIFAAKSESAFQGSPATFRMQLLEMLTDHLNAEVIALLQPDAMLG